MAALNSMQVGDLPVAGNNIQVCVLSIFLYLYLYLSLSLFLSLSLSLSLSHSLSLYLLFLLPSPALQISRHIKRSYLKRWHLPSSRPANYSVLPCDLCRLSHIKLTKQRLSTVIIVYPRFPYLLKNDGRSPTNFSILLLKFNPLFPPDHPLVPLPAPVCHAEHLDENAAFKSNPSRNEIPVS